MNKNALAILAVLFTSIALADDFNSHTFSARQPSARSRPLGRYPWKTSIVTTVFWIGERPSGNNPVPNQTSSWDKQWARNYGGLDDPNPANPRKYTPARVLPRQKPFYFAPPYNNKQPARHPPATPRAGASAEEGA